MRQNFIPVRAGKKHKVPLVGAYEVRCVYNNETKEMTFVDGLGKIYSEAQARMRYGDITVNRCWETIEQLNPIGDKA